MYLRGSRYHGKSGKFNIYNALLLAIVIYVVIILSPSRLRSRVVEPLEVEQESSDDTSLYTDPEERKAEQDAEQRKIEFNNLFDEESRIDENLDEVVKNNAPDQPPVKDVLLQDQDDENVEDEKLVEDENDSGFEIGKIMAAAAAASNDLDHTQKKVTFDAAVPPRDLNTNKDNDREMGRKTESEPDENKKKMEIAVAESKRKFKDDLSQDEEEVGVSKPVAEERPVKESSRPSKDQLVEINQNNAAEMMLSNLEQQEWRAKSKVPKKEEPLRLIDSDGKLEAAASSEDVKQVGAGGRWRDPDLLRMPNKPVEKPIDEDSTENEITGKQGNRKAIDTDTDSIEDDDEDDIESIPNPSSHSDIPNSSKKLGVEVGEFERPEAPPKESASDLLHKNLLLKEIAIKKNAELPQHLKAAQNSVDAQQPSKVPNKKEKLKSVNNLLLAVQKAIPEVVKPEQAPPAAQDVLDQEPPQKNDNSEGHPAEAKNLVLKSDDDDVEDDGDAEEDAQASKSGSELTNQASTQKKKGANNVADSDADSYGEI
ncbi:hypothetical protein HDU67_009963 [Dinochytrium kinnereticum]|nr:hypothetical protein HDU67_009963 [Dinochytrium kinnereticum]